jgi:hypothetical protein
VVLVLIVGIVLGGIPGFPHATGMILRWRKAYSARPYTAVSLAVLWTGVIGFFSYITLKTTRILVSPKLASGVLQSVSETSANADPGFWIELSGSRHTVKYDRDLSSRLDSVDMLGARVDLRIGVGDRVLSVDVVQDRGRPDTAS